MKEFFFKYRGYTPIPFFILAIVYANPQKDLFIFGILLVIFGELIRIWGVAYAGCATRTREVKEAPLLVTNGPYAFMRNPLYFGNMFIYSGFIIATGALLPSLLYITILFFSIQYSLIVSLEEKGLEELFGEQYLQYKRAVPRFYLRLSPYPGRTQIKADYFKALKSEKTTFLSMAILLAILAARWFFMVN